MMNSLKCIIFWANPSGRQQALKNEFPLRKHTFFSHLKIFETHNILIILEKKDVFLPTSFFKAPKLQNHETEKLRFQLVEMKILLPKILIRNLQVIMDDWVQKAFQNSPISICGPEM